MDALRRGINLANFEYSCLGYSIYFDIENSSADSQTKVVKLPLCIIGLEMLKENKFSKSPIDHVLVPSYKSEVHERNTPQGQPRLQSDKPPHGRGDEFFNRFKRNAGLVASGVAKNLKRVGKCAKETLDDLNPYRKGPK